jgi:hypothetical protein
LQVCASQMGERDRPRLDNEEDRESEAAQCTCPLTYCSHNTILRMKVLRVARSLRNDRKPPTASVS